MAIWRPELPCGLLSTGCGRDLRSGHRPTGVSSWRGSGRTRCCSRPATRMTASQTLTVSPREPAAELWRSAAEGSMADDAEDRATKCCDECGSDYVAATSQMTQLCPECAHWLYG